MTDTELIAAAERAERWTGCIKCAAKDASVDYLEGEVQSLQAKLSDATALAYNLDPDRTDPNVRSLCEQISHLGKHIAEYKDLIDDYAVRHGEAVKRIRELEEEVYDKTEIIATLSRSYLLDKITELQERSAKLEKAIVKHKCSVWGVNGKVGHDQDVILYATLKETK